MVTDSGTQHHVTANHPEMAIRNMFRREDIFILALINMRVNFYALSFIKSCYLFAVIPLFITILVRS